MKDNELKGMGNSLDFGARIYDSRLSRFLSVDPLTKNYPCWSPYTFAANSPILFKDMEGRNPVVIIGGVAIAVEEILIVAGVVTISGTQLNNGHRFHGPIGQMLEDAAKNPWNISFVGAGSIWLWVKLREVFNEDDAPKVTTEQVIANKVIAVTEVIQGLKPEMLKEQFNGHVPDYFTETFNGVAVTVYFLFAKVPVVSWQGNYGDDVFNKGVHVDVESGKFSGEVAITGAAGGLAVNIIPMKNRNIGEALAAKMEDAVWKKLDNPAFVNQAIAYASTCITLAKGRLNGDYQKRVIENFQNTIKALNKHLEELNEKIQKANQKNNQK
jgi:RHS repeat-associated protein